MSADDRQCAVFLRPCAFARLFSMGGRWWGGFGLPVPTFRSSNPAICPPTPFGSGVRASENANVGGRILRQSMHARTGQQSHLIRSIVRAALRDAATASTYQDALDATGAALAAIAALVRAEVHHG